MDEKQINIKQKIFGLILCSIVFAIVYNFTAWYAASFENVPSFVFEIEKNIPFIASSIIPYITSGIFFCAVFFVVQTKEQLIVLTKRMLFIILISGICFMLFPLKFSIAKPEINNSILEIPFLFLQKMDSPFNQSPSLHIAFAFVFWSVFRNFKSGRRYIIIWLILLGISTLTTYQHHLIDVFSGAILAQLTFVIFPFRKNDFQFRNFIVANFYFLFAWIFAFLALIIQQFVTDFGFIFLWISLMNFVIGFHYQKNKTRFLKDKFGTIPLLKKLFYLPYLIVYWFFWKFFRKNKIPVELISGLYVSSRLNQSDLNEFNKDECNIIVYDLSAELEEIKELKVNKKYHSVPFLDIGTFDLITTQNLVNQIFIEYKQRKSNDKILIHCTMGFTRSSVIGILVMKKVLSLTLEEVLIIVKSRNKYVVIHSYLFNFMKKVNI